MAGEGAAGDYTDIILFLATAGVVVPIFRRLKLSPTLGFLGAGVILGPFLPRPGRTQDRARQGLAR